MATFVRLLQMKKDMRGPVPGQIDVYECALKEVDMFH